MNSPFSVQADSAQKITVDSKLIYAIWQAKAAYGDCEALFEVRTSFVGEGAEVKIKGTTDSGKNLGKLDAKIFGNRLIAGFPIPKNVPMDDLAYLEVRLPKHGLQGETNRIPTRPPILVKQMQWSAQEARRGDVLTLTCAFQSQIPNDTEVVVVIYEYDTDGSHDPIAKIPTTVQNGQVKLQWEYEYHADTDEIPTQEELQKYGKNYNHPEYFFVVVIDGVRIGVTQESGLLKFKDWVYLKILDHNNNPLSNKECDIKFPDSSTKKGKSDTEGVIYFKDISPGVSDVEISFPGPINHQYINNSPKRIMMGSKIPISSGNQITIRFLPDVRLRFVEEKWDNGIVQTALAAAKFDLEIDTIRTSEETDNNGDVILILPEDAKEGKICVHHPNGTDYIYPLLFDSLKKIEERDGIIQRLYSLGLLGTQKDLDNIKLRIAIKGFQASKGLSITGELNADTQKALKESYGA
jgi:hypothetical protein